MNVSMISRVKKNFSNFTCNIKNIKNNAKEKFKNFNTLKKNILVNNKNSEKKGSSPLHVVQQNYFKKALNSRQ